MRRSQAFANLYRTQQTELPPECCEADYEARPTAAYPIHPEDFNRLWWPAPPVNVV
mgnify:FL=1